MTIVDAYVSHAKPCISEWAVSHGFALAMAFCLLFWGGVGLAIALL
jgi:hypothetical protein